MQTTSEDSGLTEDFIIPLPSLTSSNSPNIVYVSFTRNIPDQYAVASFQCTLKFVSKELDPSTGAPEEEGYEDEYQLEDVELSAGGDYIIPSYATFGAEWDRLRSGPSATETFALSAMDSLKGTVAFQTLISCRLAELTRLCTSRMRFNYRSGQYGASWWYRSAFVNVCSHTTVVWISCRWWWKSTCTMPYDLFTRARRHVRA